MLHGEMSFWWAEIYSQNDTCLQTCFQYDQFTQLAFGINGQDGGEVIAAIFDGNRVNQKFFSLFDVDPERPWYSREYNIFLLYDYVHLLKCIRNNWLNRTEWRVKVRFQWKRTYCKVVRSRSVI